MNVLSLWCPWYKINVLFIWLQAYICHSSFKGYIYLQTRFFLYFFFVRGILINNSIIKLYRTSNFGRWVKFFCLTLSQIQNKKKIYYYNRQIQLMIKGLVIIWILDKMETSQRRKSFLSTNLHFRVAWIFFLLKNPIPFIITKQILYI